MLVIDEWVGFVCRLENLDLMVKYGSDAWLKNNGRLEVLLSRLGFLEII